VAKSASGQVFTEYTMVLGLLTAIIIAVTSMMFDSLGWIVARLVRHLIVYMASGWS
jgi:Flp pilus assembly pilin Flp